MTASPESSDPWTIAKVLRWAADDLARRGVGDSPRVDAEVLLCHALRITRVQLIVDGRRPLSTEELAAYRALIVRRRRAEPVAYILGSREFHGLRFQVGPNVLIPRPDTETLVEVALERTRGRSEFGRALDLCTGSGCVAIAFAKQRPTWQVTGSDISGGALRVARRNALALGAIWGVSFVQSDLFEGLAAQPPLDLIVSNPPYVSDADMGELSRDILDHEPHLALRGGPDGLALMRPLVKEAVRKLAQGGVLAVEVGAGQAERVAKGLRAYDLQDVRIDQDYGGIGRVVSGRRPETAHDRARGARAAPPVR